MLVPWAKKVERESGGRLSITVYPSMQLGGQAPQLIDQARDGVVDIVWTLAGYTPGRFPRLEAFELPFLNTNRESKQHAGSESSGRGMRGPGWSWPPNRVS